MESTISCRNWRPKITPLEIPRQMKNWYENSLKLKVKIMQSVDLPAYGSYYWSVGVVDAVDMVSVV